MILGCGSGSGLRWKRGQFLCMAQCMFYSKESWPARGHLTVNAVGVQSQKVREESRKVGRRNT